MKVIIAGGREVKDYGLVVKAMENADLLMGITPTIVFSGRATGVILKWRYRPTRWLQFGMGYRLALLT